MQAASGDSAHGAGPGEASSAGAAGIGGGNRAPQLRPGLSSPSLSGSPFPALTAHRGRNSFVQGRCMFGAVGCV